MTSIQYSKQYNVNSLKTMIDLNKDVASFTIKLKLNSDRPFLYSIVNQEILDNQDIEFTEETSVEHLFDHIDKPFQNYFLILKSPSDEDVKVNVQTTFTEVKSDAVSPERRSLIERRLDMDPDDIRAKLYGQNRDVRYILAFVMFVIICMYLFRRSR